MADSVRSVVDDVLSRAMTREIWSGDYHKALPVTLQDYELSAVLPAVFYMFRFGQRRGAGKFLETFGSSEGSPAQRRRSATVERIAEKMASSRGVAGFDSPEGKAILGDLLLCFCLENAKHSQGRDQQVQRIGPAHYLASRVDLPQHVAHLRYIPEMIVATLADQDGEHVKVNDEGDKTWFAVGRGYEDNVLLRAFSQGVVRQGDVLENLSSDRFNEGDVTVGLDQLLTIRLAGEVEEAPSAVPGRQASRISNQRPLTERAARNFSDDIRRFLRAYSTVLPRHALVDMLESCISVGMTTILSSLVEMLLAWADQGRVPERSAQRSTAVLVDCSNGVDLRLRGCAEQSMGDLMRRMERLPDVLMVLRLLDHHAVLNKKVKKESVETRPYATDWINLLGDLLHSRHSEAHRIHYSIEEKAERLADKLTNDHGEVKDTLINADSQPNPVWRLAYGLTTLMGPTLVRRRLSGFIDSSLLIGRPNGLAAKRKTSRGGRRRDVRSLVLTDPVIEYLVHLHLLRGGNKPGVRRLSFGEFIDALRNRYGFCIDVAPLGMSISNELLQRNRAILERRLRDLGLLAGVNDAEAMKRLWPRFKPAREN